MERTKRPVVVKRKAKIIFELSAGEYKNRLVVVLEHNHGSVVGEYR